MNTAKIYSYSIVYVSSAEFKHDIPYLVAILEDEKQRRFPAKVIGYCESRKVHIGDSVELLTDDKEGHVTYIL